MTEEYDELMEPIQGPPAAEPEETAPENDHEGTPAPPEDTAPSEKLSAEGLPEEQLRSIVEVLLLVSDRPLSASRIGEVLEGPDNKRIEEILGWIQERLDQHGFPFTVRQVAGGYVLSTRPEYAPWVRKFYAPKVKASKLSQAALETLAVIAYKQPVTRAEIEAIRGVNVDSTLRTLLEKNLVEIVGFKDVIGKPATYGTTNEFLLHFGLKALSDLPSIEELRTLNPDQ